MPTTAQPTASLTAPVCRYCSWRMTVAGGIAKCPKCRNTLSMNDKTVPLHLTHVLVDRDPAQGLSRYLNDVAPGALSDPYVRQALANLLEAIEEATAPAET